MCVYVRVYECVNTRVSMYVCNVDMHVLGTYVGAYLNMYVCLF